jgi:hypothetical protein
VIVGEGVDGKPEVCFSVDCLPDSEDRACRKSHGDMTAISENCRGAQTGIICEVHCNKKHRAVTLMRLPVSICSRDELDAEYKYRG